MILWVLIIIGFITGIFLGLLMDEGWSCVALCATVLAAFGLTIGVFTSLVMCCVCPRATLDVQEYDLIPIAENTYWIDDNGYKSYNDINVYYKDKTGNIVSAGARAEDLIFVNNLEKPYIKIEKEDIVNTLCRDLAIGSEITNHTIYLPAYVAEGVTE